MKKILALICFCSLAACAPPPKTAVDLQMEKLVHNEEAIAKETDELAARAAALAHVVTVQSNQAVTKLEERARRLQAECDRANAEYLKAWQMLSSDDIK